MAEVHGDQRELLRAGACGLALAAGPTKITDLVAKIYVDVPEALHDMAGRSVLAHLQKLKAEGRVSGRDVNSAWKVA